MAGLLLGTAALTAASGATVATGTAATAIAAGGVASLSGATLATTTGLLGVGGSLALAPTLTTLGVAGGLAAGGVTAGLTAAQARAAGELAESQAGAQIAEAELGEAERALVRYETLRRASAETIAAAAVSGRDPSAVLSDMRRLTQRGLDIDRARTNLATAIFGANAAAARADARRGEVGGLLSGFSSITRFGRSLGEIGGP